MNIGAGGIAAQTIAQEMVSAVYDRSNGMAPPFPKLIIDRLHTAVANAFFYFDLELKFLQGFHSEAKFVFPYCN